MVHSPTEIRTEIRNHMSQLAPYYRSLLVAVLQRLLVSEHITEHPSIYFGIPNRIDVLDAMLVLVLTKFLSSQQSAITVTLARPWITPPEPLRPR